MKPPRRQFLHLAAGAVALPAVSRIARAQAYPSRPVRIIVPVGTGGGTDILARVIGQWLSERLGQQFFVEATNWYGVSAPRNTPIGIIELLNKTINAGLTDPKLRSQLADLGGTPMPASPADFGKLVAGETEKWRKVIRAANIKLE
jgi:tripartite-type tricarboxylate transporter receptor subunit TctC